MTGISTRVGSDMTARRSSSADGTRSADQKDTIVSPPSRAQSCPSLAMPSIHSIQYKPAPLLAISSTSVCYEYKPTPLLEISSISVCYEVSQPDTSTTSLAERKDIVTGVPITPLGVKLDPVGVSPAPPISTDNVVVKPTPLFVDIDNSMDHAVREENPIHSEPAMKSNSSNSSDPDSSSGDEPVSVILADPYDTPGGSSSSDSSSDSSKESSSKPSNSSHIYRSKTSKRTIDFGELKQMAAEAKTSKPSNKVCPENTTIAPGTSPRLSKKISRSKKVRSRLSEPSIGHRMKKNRPLPRDRSSLQEDPDDAIVIEDSSNDDHEEIAQQDPDETQDLMEFAYLDGGQIPLEKGEQPTLEHNQKRSSKRVRVPSSYPGFVEWKSLVDTKLANCDSLWLKTQTDWISLRDNTKKYTGSLMSGFDKKICSVAKRFSSGRVCASEVLALEKSWRLTYTVALMQIKDERHKKQLGAFNARLKQFESVSRGIQPEHFATEEDDGDDIDWTPDTNPKRRRVE